MQPLQHIDLRIERGHTQPCTTAECDQPIRHREISRTVARSLSGAADAGPCICQHIRNPFLQHQH